MHVNLVLFAVRDSKEWPNPWKTGRYGQVKAIQLSGRAKKRTARSTRGCWYYLRMKIIILVKKAFPV